MSTRATIRFAKREEGVSFNEHPYQWNAQFYRHHDGYPEGLGVEIAESFTKYGKLLNWEVESLDIVHSDIEYLYYIWQCHGKSEPWISIFQVEEIFGKCIFVGTPDMLLKKYDERCTEVQETSDRIICEEKFVDIDSHDECDCPFPGEYCDAECECGDDRDPDFCGSGCCKNTN
jgi:hypothetical protein